MGIIIRSLPENTALELHYKLLVIFSVVNTDCYERYVLKENGIARIECSNNSTIHK